MMSTRISKRIGFWSSSLWAALGTVYLAVLVVHFSTAGFSAPTTPFVETSAGILTILSAPVFLVMFAVIAHLAPKERGVYGTIGLSFCILYVAMVSINRFVQLTVVRLSSQAEQSADLARFLPYAPGSVMFALEILGWGFFLSLACLFVAPLFSGSSLRRSIRWLFVLFALFSFTSVVGLATQTPVGAAAFVAWGPIAVVLSVLLAVLFRRGDLPSLREETAVA